MSAEPREVIVDFLDAWRYCPVSEAPGASRVCLEDAADQLLAALGIRATEAANYWLSFGITEWAAKAEHDRRRIVDLEGGIKQHRHTTLTRLNTIDPHRARMMDHDKNLYALLEKQ